MPDMFGRMPYCCLPRSFQDAVGMTRVLGIHNPWIDSCGVIQRSDSDWAVESAKMGAKYKGAALDLGSACASSAYGGRLYPRLQVPVYKLDGGTSLRYRVLHLIGDFNPSPSWRGGCELKSPLNPSIYHSQDEPGICTKEYCASVCITSRTTRSTGVTTAGSSLKTAHKALSLVNLGFGISREHQNPPKKWFEAVRIKFAERYQMIRMPPKRQICFKITDRVVALCKSYSAYTIQL